MRAKRPFSLLEVTIGLSLTAILLGFLFASYRQIAKHNLMVQQIQHEVHARTCLNLRLQQLFEQAVADPPFRSIEGHLSFTFDNGLDLDPHFCGPVNGRLFLEGQTLTFRSASQKGKASRIEHLFKGLSAVKWSFFNMKQKEWVDSWPTGNLPPLIRLTLLRDKQPPLAFLFEIPDEKPMVAYNK